jgi:Tfp pilus assembly protein PilN
MSESQPSKPIRPRWRRWSRAALPWLAAAGVPLLVGLVADTVLGQIDVAHNQRRALVREAIDRSSRELAKINQIRKDMSDIQARSDVLTQVLARAREARERLRLVLEVPPAVALLRVDLERAAVAIEGEALDAAAVAELAARLGTALEVGDGVWIEVLDRGQPLRFRMGAPAGLFRSRSQDGT